MTTIRDTCDCDVGRGRRDLCALEAIGFAANRRLLKVQTIGHNCSLGEGAFQQLRGRATCGNH